MQKKQKYTVYKLWSNAALRRPAMVQQSLCDKRPTEHCITRCALGLYTYSRISFIHLFKAARRMS